MPASEDDLAARLRADDIRDRRAAVRECRDVSTRDGSPAWPTVAALAVAATCADRTTRLLAKATLVESRTAWSEERDRVSTLLQKIAAPDPDTGPEDPGDDRGRAVLVEHLARARKTSVLGAGSVLGRALEHDDREVRRALASALFVNGSRSRNGVVDCIDAIVPHATNLDPAVRAAVTTALGVSAVLGPDATHEDAAAAIVDRLGDPDSSVRRAAVQQCYEVTASDLREAYGPRLHDRYVRLTTACLVDPDPLVRRKATYLVRPETIRTHPNWRSDLLPMLTETFAEGDRQAPADLLRRTVAEEPDAILPHVESLLDPGGAVRDRAAGARVATVLLESPFADRFPTDRAVDAAIAVIDERPTAADVRTSLATLESVAEHRPDRVMNELPTLYRAFADGNRKIRDGAHDVLVTLASRRPEAVPEPVRALAETDDEASDDPLLPVLDSAPEFARDRIAEFVSLVAEHPGVVDELYWRWWIADVVAADPTAVDGAIGRLAMMLEAGGRDRDLAGTVLRACAEDGDLEPLLRPLLRSLRDGPEKTPLDVLVAFRHVVSGRPGLVEPVAGQVSAWLTWHDGRNTAATVLSGLANGTLRTSRESLSPAARTLVDADALSRDRDPLAALAVVDPGAAEGALEAIVDRFCAHGTGGPADVLDAIMLVHAETPDRARRVVRRLDNRLGHYGRRLDTAEAFVDRVEDGPGDVAAAGLGLVLTALEYNRGKFRRRVAPVLKRIAETDPEAVAPHVAGVVERLTDWSDIRESAADLSIALLETDPDEATLQTFATTLRTTVLATTPAHSSSHNVLKVFGALRKRAPEYAADVAAPLALDAMVDAAGGFDEIPAATLFRTLRETASLADPTHDSRPFDERTVVVTGSIEEYTRAEFQEALERHGARTTGSISGRTDLLVVGDRPGLKKRRDALAEGVPMVRAPAVRRLLEED